MRHNAILLSALKRVFLDFFGFVSMTTDVAALAMGLGKHADAQVQTDHHSFMAVLSGQKDRNRSLLIDLTIVNTGCTTNVNSTEDMLEQAAERKLQKYGPTAEAAGTSCKCYLTRGSNAGYLKSAYLMTHGRTSGLYTDSEKLDR